MTIPEDEHELRRRINALLAEPKRPRRLPYDVWRDRGQWMGTCAFANRLPDDTQAVPPHRSYIQMPLPGLGEGPLPELLMPVFRVERPRLEANMGHGPFRVPAWPRIIVLPHQDETKLRHLEPDGLRVKLIALRGADVQHMGSIAIPVKAEDALSGRAKLVQLWPGMDVRLLFLGDGGFAAVTRDMVAMDHPSWRAGDED